ncbi:MAG: T9SS type A sorting domain-containing protein [Bacteroidota bacterium]|nr:T9SS type A sorting domain-containing protein [Bacteroidota bacterium]
MKSKLLLVSLILLASFNLFSQVAKTQVLMINATAASDGITLTWPQMPGTFTGQILIYKRDSFKQTDWGNAIATLGSTATNYKDISATKGKAIEYRVVTANGSNAVSFGYIYAGNELKENLFKGGIVLLIDSNFMLPLASEINRLENDLYKEGWIVSKLYVSRNSKPSSVKARLKTHITSRSKKPVTTLLILGHVPVPYSGGFTGNSQTPPPDGHVEGSGNHTGAWPADGYYGNLLGGWTDEDVNLVTGAQSRHHNIPGDGKFDQSKFPDPVNLEVGRIDLFNMSSFGKTDTVLTRNYLNRNHLWRTGQTKTIERALIDNNFTGLNLASTGYHNFSAFFSFDSIYDNKDYITTLKSNSYLWSYGCGAGGYTSCSGIGNTGSFVADSIQSIYTILAGSFFGDWDIANNFLKAPLCKGSLASFWGGIPKWYIHTMGLGKHIGFGTLTSMNNINFYFDGQFNGSGNSVHMALMGDPTLCNRHLPHVKTLTATSNNNKVNLRWTKANGDFDGYAIYRLDTISNILIKATNYLIQDTFYIDSANYISGPYRYYVSTIKKETTASGIYYNTGGTANALVNHVNSVNDISKKKIAIYPNPSSGILNFNQDGLKQFRLFDRAGREINIYTDYQNKTIDINHLPNGIYILRAVDENNLEISVPIIKLAE